MDELKELRRLVKDAAALLSNASSGNVSGSRPDLEFDKNRDDWLGSAAIVEAATPVSTS